MNRHKRQTAPDPPSWRRHFLLGLLAVAAVALEVRLAWLQLIQGDFLTAAGEQLQQRVVEMPVHRGLITDRFGEPLAVSTPVESIFVNPQEIPLDREVIYALADAVGKDGADLEREITSRLDKEFLWIKRRLAPRDAARVLELEIPGVSSRHEYKRFYPQHEVACHLIGITDSDDAGLEGIEYRYDHRLTGEPGSKSVLRDVHGRQVADIEQIEPAIPGRDLLTSIDLRLQYPAYRELKSVVQASGASSGSMVILDVTTGEVLAMVNQPSCNPNDSGARSDMARFRNRAITDPIEPGSTVKPLVLATALESGYRPETLIDVPQILEFAGEELTRDSRPLGIVTVREILARSSSVGMGTIAAELDTARVWQTLKNFGIAGATDSQLGGIESHGSLENYEYWGEKKRRTISYGYGLSVTPLQLARAYAAIASGGLLPPISYEALTAPPERVQVISPTIAAELMAMLETVVGDGTARRAAIPNYLVAGKTGTARIHQSGGYSDRYRALFVGIAPASQPRFVAVVLINDPQGAEYEGGQVAAPVFAKVIGAALRMYGVAPDAIEPAATLIARAGIAR